MPVQLTLLDAPSLWYRAFHGVPESVTAPDGSPVNAVRGTIDIIARIVRDTRPARLVACLDLDWRPAFRVAAVPSYKAHRLTENGAEAEPETLAPQVETLLEVFDAVGLCVVGAEGHEADDVLGTLSARESGAVDVVSGDRDMFQLVRDDGPHRVLYAAEKLKPYGAAEVAAKYGIPGIGYAEFAVLRGDPSDGLPGVKGVGDKTAAALISRFGTIEAILKALQNRLGRGLSRRRPQQVGECPRLPTGGTGGHPYGPGPADSRAGRCPPPQPSRPGTADHPRRPVGPGQPPRPAAERSRGGPLGRLSGGG